MLLHAMQEFDNDFRTGSDQDLSLSSFLGIVDGIERIIEDASLDHTDGALEILNPHKELRYLLGKGRVSS